MSTLVLGIPLGDEFYVGHVAIRVVEIESATRFQVLDESTGVSYWVGEEEAVEVLKDVRLSCGLRSKMDFARVVIQAPLSVEILRKSLYLAKYGQLGS